MPYVTISDIVGGGKKLRHYDNGDGTYDPVVHVSAQDQADSSASTNTTAAASSTQLVTANAARTGLIIFNDADKPLFVKYGTAASPTSFTVKIAAGGYWEMPAPIYTGVVHGIWEAGPTGAARVTELI